MSHKLLNHKVQRLASTTPGITDLAKKALVSDRTIVNAENSGAIGVSESERLAAAMGVSLATLGKVDF